MPNTHSFFLVLTISIVTISIRFLPFILLSKKQTPKTITYLGNVLPYSIMGMLIIYCLRNISFASSPFGIPEIIGAAIAFLLHYFKRNTLLSIITSTIVYMLLVQLVF